MPDRTVDVVVVGAGIIGASIAYQLARHGAGRVEVVDKGAGPGEGSTGASSSISRCRYTHWETIRLAHLRRRKRVLRKRDLQRVVGVERQAQHRGPRRLILQRR